MTAQEARVRTALDRLRPACSAVARFEVAPGGCPGAYSWSNGTVRVTTGLLAILDDDELAAALAHEMGHLLRHEQGLPPFALDGGPALREEERADAIGISLLRRAGLPTTALASALAKVLDAGVERPETRRDLTHRIELLNR